jgi:hypothetical protein
VRRYVPFGKAAREIMGQIKYPLREFGYNLSQLASLVFERAAGVGVGSDLPEAFSADDLMEYESITPPRMGSWRSSWPSPSGGIRRFGLCPLSRA